MNQCCKSYFKSECFLLICVTRERQIESKREGRRKKKKRKKITVITSLIWVPRTVNKDDQKKGYLEVSQTFRTVAKARLFFPA